jgi:hypothetical protein
MPERRIHGSKGRMGTWRTRLLTLPLAAGACAIALLPGSASASTVSAAASHAAAASPCAGKSQSYILAKYKRGSVVYPLRCGTSTWGYIHLVDKHEYDPSAISVTVSRGGQNSSGHFFYKEMPQHWRPERHWRPAAGHYHSLSDMSGGN